MKDVQSVRLLLVSILKENVGTKGVFRTVVIFELKT